MNIAFVITPQMLTTSLTTPYELIYAANQAASAHQGSENNVSLKKLDSLITSDKPNALSLASDGIIDDTLYDLIYLPALWRNPRPVIKRSQGLLEWLKHQHEHGAIINSVGTGVCFMAEAGLLDGKAATTHWYYMEQFAKDYPNVQLKRQYFITAAGNVFCCASINSLTDLTIHHIHRFFSQEVSQHIESHFSPEVRKPFDKMSYFQEQNSNHPDEVILQAQLWIQNHLNRASLSIQKVAELFDMSHRNFTRRFKHATNMTPMQYLQSHRISTARELLKSSNLSIGEIAYRVGYLDVSHFIKLFKQTVSTTPKEYRNRIRAKLYHSQEITQN